MSIIGVGIDVAEIERFPAPLERTPGLAERLFLDSELLLPSGERRGVASLAARFAAKEALAKALGAPPRLHWTAARPAPARGGPGVRRGDPGPPPPPHKGRGGPPPRRPRRHVLARLAEP